MNQFFVALGVLVGTASFACPLGSNWLPPGEVLESGCTIIAAGNGQGGFSPPWAPGTLYCPQSVMSGSVSCYYVKKCTIPGVDYCLRKVFHQNGTIQVTMNTPLVCPSGLHKAVDRSGSTDKCIRITEVKASEGAAIR
jgi:hypothetical protein